MLPFIIDLICKWFPSERATPYDDYWNEKRGALPKAGKKKQRGFLIILFLPFISHAQFFTTGSAGITNKNFSATWDVGMRVQNVTIRAGYIAIPKPSEPVLFNVYAGYMATTRLHVFGGYGKVMYSTDNKQRNGNTWSAGAQYHWSLWSNGSMYVGGTYAGNKTVTLHIGMSYNLIRSVM